MSGSGFNPEELKGMAADMGLEIPWNLRTQFEELDERYDGWNSFVHDVKKRQRELELSGANGVVGYQDIKILQSRFNSFDPMFLSRERRFGSAAIAFNGFIVDRVDEFGQRSVELKSTESNRIETAESAQCDVHVYHLDIPGVTVPAKLLSLKVLDMDADNWGSFHRYLHDPSADVYVPALNLAEITH